MSAAGSTPQVVHNFRNAAKEKGVSDKSSDAYFPVQPYTPSSPRTRIFQFVSHDTRVQVAQFGASCFELPWGCPVNMQSCELCCVFYCPCVVTPRVPTSIPTSALFPGCSASEVGHAPSLEQPRRTPSFRDCCAAVSGRGPCLSWQARPQHRHTPSSASHFHSVKVSA